MSTTSDQGAPPPNPWSERLLPLMMRMLVGLTLFFFAATIVELYNLQSRINDAPVLQASDLALPFGDSTHLLATVRIDLYRAHTAAILERNVVARRYHQLNVLLMSRVWSNYLGFVTGMILALVGSGFTLGQLQSATHELEGKSTALSFNWKSASPGITLSVLGVALMITTILTNHEISARDMPVYFGKETLGTESGKPDIRLPLDSIRLSP